MRLRPRRLIDRLISDHPGLEDPEEAIAAGRVLVEGRPITNRNSLVRPQSPVAVKKPARLRGTAKLAPAMAHFGVGAGGRVALDAGAAAGGFTKALLDAGARRVYAVDAGHGQLLGSLRQDPRVVNLEATNLGELSPELVPERLEVVTLDLSYLAVARAAAQLNAVALARGADLVALVKPMFELGLAKAPADRASLDEALRRAGEGIEAAGWSVLGWMDSPVIGAGGAPELFLHARRAVPNRSGPPSGTGEETAG